MMVQKNRHIVLGGGGFIGSILCAKLIKENLNVISVTRNEIQLKTLLKSNNFLPVYGDVRDLNFLMDLFKEGDIIYDLANPYKPISAQSDITTYLNFSIHSILSIAEAAKKKFASKLVYISSAGTVYGNSYKEKSMEDDALTPISIYGQGKVISEKILEAALTDTKTTLVIARPSNPYGKTGPNDHGILDVLLSKLQKDEELEIWTSLETSRDFIHVNDLAEALSILGTKRIKQNIYNLGSGEILTLRDLIAKTEYILNKKLKYNLKEEKSQDVISSSIDSTRFKNEFNWTPNWSVENYIKLFSSI